MDILKDMFDAAMKREKKEVALFYDSTKKFDAFFRKNNDNTERRDTMIMYYACNAPVTVGALLSYGSKTFMVLNQETTENSIYYKSAIIRTNGVINTHSLSVFGLPFYGEDTNNANLQVLTNFNLIDGNVKAMTQDCEASRALQIDDLLNEWGRTWKISNLIYVDGICHAYIEVTENVNPVYEYTVELSELSSVYVEPEDTDTLSATAYINGNQVSDAVIVFSSSDDEVATIDEHGNIEYLADGDVYFTATWTEHNVSAVTDTVTVASAAEETVSIYVQPITEIAYDFPEELTYYAMRGNVRDDTIPVSFKIENLNVSSNYNYYAKRITVTDNGNHTIELSVEDSIMQGKTFDLVAYNTELAIENRQNIRVVSLF